MRGGATFDRSGRYRYALWRHWDRSLPAIAFIMLNPNRADATRNDPTIRRCVRFAHDWGFGTLRVINLFALCARQPSALGRAGDPIGPRNDHYLRRWTRDVDAVVAAWGVHGGLLSRDRDVLASLERRRIEALCLGRTKAGHPCHPLYLRADTTLRPLRT